MAKKKKSSAKSSSQKNRQTNKMQDPSMLGGAAKKKTSAAAKSAAKSSPNRSAKNAAKSTSKKSVGTKKNTSDSRKSAPKAKTSGTSARAKNTQRAKQSNKDFVKNFTAIMPSGKTLAVRIGILVIIILALMLLVHQLYLHFYMGLKTMTAVEITIAETIETTGWTVRDETVITTDRSGVIVPDVDNGGKVSKGEAVALVFPSADAANAYMRIADIEQSIEEFESMITAKEDVIFENSVDGKLDDELITLARAISSNDMDDINELNADLLYLLNKKQIATHTVESFDANIAELKTEKSELQSAYPDAPGRITSSLSGYYISMVDGYENILTTSALKEMTPESFDSALAGYTGEVPASAVGKVADDYVWDIACKISAQEAERMTVGKSYELELPYSEVESVKGKLTALNTGSGNEVLAIFEISVTVPELLEVRTQPVTIVLMEATGLGVPKEALRVNRYMVSSTDADGNLTGESHEESDIGVYIMYGRSIKFRKVEIIHTVDDMVVVEVNNGSGWLKRYDDIIVGGKGLYDGKIVQY